MDTLTWLKNLKYGQDDKQKDATKLPCLSGWIHNIIALRMLVSEVVGVEPGVEYLVTNCDTLENLLSVYDGNVVSMTTQTPNNSATD